MTKKSWWWALVFLVTGCSGDDTPGPGWLVDGGPPTRPVVTPEMRAFIDSPTEIVECKTLPLGSPAPDYQLLPRLLYRYTHRQGDVSVEVYLEFIYQRGNTIDVSYPDVPPHAVERTFLGMVQPHGQHIYGVISEFESAKNGPATVSATVRTKRPGDPSAPAPVTDTHTITVKASLGDSRTPVFHVDDPFGPYPVECAR